jgi:hypothetical protein
MSDNKYTTFSMQIFLTFSLVIIGTIISTLRISTFILIYLHITKVNTFSLVISNLERDKVY